MAYLGLFRRNWKFGVLLLVVASVIGACSGSSPAESTAGGSPSESTAATVAPTAKPTVAAAVSGSAGGILGMDDTLDQVFKLYEELLGVLAGVTDEASARGAADDVARITGEFRELEDRMDNLSPAELASVALTGRFQNFGQELGMEMVRISANPAAYAILAGSLENLGSDEAPTSSAGTTPSDTIPPRILETVTPSDGRTEGTPVIVIQPSAESSAGGAACLLFGAFFAKYAATLDPSTLLDVADSIRNLQASGEAAEEQEIRDAVRGLIAAVDNDLGVPDNTFGTHMNAMGQVCLTEYMDEYLKGFQP